MSMYLNQTGRPMLYSCSWPAYVVFNGQIVSVQHSVPVKGRVYDLFINYFVKVSIKTSNVIVKQNEIIT